MQPCKEEFNSFHREEFRLGPKASRMRSSFGVREVLMRWAVHHGACDLRPLRVCVKFSR